MRGQTGHAQPYARLPPSFLSMDAQMTSELNIASIRKQRGSLIYLLMILTCYPCLFVVADVRSTGTGFKRLHCTCTISIDTDHESARDFNEIAECLPEMTDERWKN